jgi:hypothetical protein
MVPWTTKEELNKILERHPEIKDIFIDWTERQVCRSIDNEKQKQNYSWKKKKHTIKNLVITGDNKMILWISKTFEWKTHDYNMLKQSWFMDSLLWYILWVDSWFQWITKDYVNHIINMPKKNSKNNKLTQKEKDTNRIISSIRVIIENIIWWAKKYWIIKYTYRNRIRWNFTTVVQNRKHTVMLTVCWLYNLEKSKIFIT